MGTIQIAPLSRIDFDEVLGLIRDEKYFVLHAPRQTGKTSALLALRDLLNGGQAGDFRCLYANVENGQAMRENVAEGMRTVLAELAYQASVTLGDETLEEQRLAALREAHRVLAGIFGPGYPCLIPAYSVSFPTIGIHDNSVIVVGIMTCTHPGLFCLILSYSIDRHHCTTCNAFWANDLRHSGAFCLIPGG